MRIRFLVTGYLALSTIAQPSLPLPPGLPGGQTTAAAKEDRLPVKGASLYVREVGRGRPLVVLHGGPDFDIGYLLPELDRLGDAFRLIYYDQRGRGRSAEGVRPDDVTMESDVEDLRTLTQHFGLDAAALLGHSWGAVLALEYAVRYPGRVSHLILMNPAPVSTADLAMLRKAYASKLGSDLDRQRHVIASAPFKEGEPEAVAARYRIHFKFALTRPEHYETLMARMRAGFIRQGKDGIIKARAVEERLMRDTWGMDGYDLLPRLAELNVPTLVISGEDDFIPLDVATHIARAIPKSQSVTIADCGHFAYLECGDDVRRAIDRFFDREK